MKGSWVSYQVFRGAHMQNRSVTIETNNLQVVFLCAMPYLNTPKTHLDADPFDEGQLCFHP